jgi:hypothetical protein
MKPETQGKLMVAMLVSILAFGLGTATVLVAGHLQTNQSTNLNTTPQSDFPIIPNTRENNTNNLSTNSASNGVNNPSTGNNSSL